MPREIVTENDVIKAKQRRAASGSVAGGAKQLPSIDSYTERLIKLVPTEVVSIYLLMDSLLKSIEDLQVRQNIAWIIFFFLLILTPFYLARILKVSKYFQLALSTVSFAVWVFTFGGPFINLSWYQPIYGSIILPLYTLFVAVLKPDV